MQIVKLAKALQNVKHVIADIPFNLMVVVNIQVQTVKQMYLQIALPAHLQQLAQLVKQVTQDQLVQIIQVHVQLAVIHVQVAQCVLHVILGITKMETVVAYVLLIVLVVQVILIVQVVKKIIQDLLVQRTPVANVSQKLKAVIHALALIHVQDVPTILCFMMENVPV